MSDKQDSIDGMAALVATVRAGSFSRAAMSLGMTPSGASKLIARLEQRLGVQLLRRTTRSMQLTEAGELYYERAAHLLDEIDGMERDLEDHHRTPRGRVMVTAPTGIGCDLVMPVVIEFQRRYPDVTVELDLTDRIVDLVSEGFDVAIRLTDRPPESCVARKLGDDVRVLCASPSYVHKRGRPERPADLAGHHCVAFTTPNGPAAWHLRNELDGPIEAFTFSSSLSLNQTSAVHQAVLAGLGIGDLPAYLVEDELASGRLIALLAPYVPVRRTIYAIYAASRLLPAKTRAFLGVLEASFRIGRTTAIDDDRVAPADPLRVVA